MTPSSAGLVLKKKFSYQSKTNSETNSVKDRFLGYFVMNTNTKKANHVRRQIGRFCFSSTQTG